MDLASVRALKAEISEAVVRPMVEEALAEGRFGVTAHRVGLTKGATRSLALGITKGKGKNKEFQLAVRFQRRALEDDQQLLAALKERTNGEVDIRYVGQLEKQAPWHRTRQRPLLIGCSIGHHKITAGTLGGFAYHRKTNGQVIVSNNHVLANENNCSAGDAVIQCGAHDGGVAASDRVGSLLDWAQLKLNGPNLVDAAIAAIDPGIDFDPRTLTGLPYTGGRVRTTAISPGDTVWKVGRTTGVTEGRVTAIEMDDVVVRYDMGLVSFDRQIEIEGAGASAFSAGGDSGSFVLDSDGHVCGLLFAGGDTGGSNGKGLTYANEIGAVFSTLDLA